MPFVYLIKGIVNDRFDTFGDKHEKFVDDSERYDDFEYDYGGVKHQCEESYDEYYREDHFHGVNSPPGKKSGDL